MSYDEFFTDGDKPYAENLNDGLALLDAFDVTVPCSMPDMFNNGDFSSSVNVTRKCGVALVTLKSVDSGITVGTDEISGTGTVVFRVYPNFNSFYKWSKIILEKSGTVAIGFKKADGTDITVTVSGDGTIGDAAALKMLEEIDVVLTLDNASISNILIWFVNNHGERTKTGALLDAEQLVNVDGAVVDNDLRAVSGDTVKGAFDDFETDVVDEKIGDLSDSVDGKLSDLSDNVDSELTNGLALKENLSNKKTTLNSSSSNYPSCSAVKTVTDTKADKAWTSVTVSSGTLEVNASLRLANWRYSGRVTFDNEGCADLGEVIPQSYRPPIAVHTRSNHAVVDIMPVGKIYFSEGPISTQEANSVNILWKY